MTQPSPVDLQIAGQQHRNACAAARLALDRWRRGGRASGPAVLYWGELVVFIARGVAARALGEVAAALRRMAAARPRTLHAVVVRVLAHRGVADDHALARGLAAGGDVRTLAFQRRAGACSRCSPSPPSSRWCSRAFATDCWRSPTCTSRAPAIVYGGYRLVPGPDRRRHRGAEHLLGADVGVPRAVLRVGDAGWRSRWWAGCAGRSTRGRRTACGAGKWGQAAFPENTVPGLAARSENAGPSS